MRFGLGCGSRRRTSAKTGALPCRTLTVGVRMIAGADSLAEAATARPWSELARDKAVIAATLSRFFLGERDPGRSRSTAELGLS